MCQEKLGHKMYCAATMTALGVNCNICPHEKSTHLLVCSSGKKILSRNLFFPNIYLVITPIKQTVGIMFHIQICLMKSILIFLTGKKTFFMPFSIMFNPFSCSHHIILISYIYFIGEEFWKNFAMCVTNLPCSKQATAYLMLQLVFYWRPHNFQLAFLNVHC